MQRNIPLLSIAALLLSGPLLLAGDATAGWQEQKLTFKVQHPFDLKESERYAVENGVYHLWVFNDDKPFAEGNKTLPRTEMRFPDYTASEQFEADLMVPEGTNNVCVTQIHTANEQSKDSGATTYMVDVRNNGELRAYNGKVLAKNIYGRWFHLNVAHDLSRHVIECYIDGKLADTRDDNKATAFYFKCGVYEQHGGSHEMQAYIKNIKLWSRS